MIYRLKDENGNVVHGMHKNNHGSIVVERTNEYDRYLLEKQQAETINKLTNEVEELKSLVRSLLTTDKYNRQSDQTDSSTLLENKNG